jgi:hypothetical protein
VEAALAHKIPDAVRRTTYLDTSTQPGQRVKPITDWGILWWQSVIGLGDYVAQEVEGQFVLTANKLG